MSFFCYLRVFLFEGGEPALSIFPPPKPNKIIPVATVLNPVLLLSAGLEELEGGITGDILRGAESGLLGAVNLPDLHLLNQIDRSKGKRESAR